MNGELVFRSTFGKFVAAWMETNPFQGIKIDEQDEENNI